MRSKADETLVIVETLICPLQIPLNNVFMSAAYSEIFLGKDSEI